MICYLSITILSLFSILLIFIIIDLVRETIMFRKIDKDRVHNSGQTSWARYVTHDEEECQHHT